MPRGPPLGAAAGRRPRGRRRRRATDGGGFFAIVRGPLGAGKTTVARALAARLRGRRVGIDPILERRRWDGGSEALFLRANRVAAARAAPTLARGRPVVFDGNFYWSRAVDDLLRRLPYPGTVFRLDVPLADCIVRDRGRRRPYGAAAARAVYAKAARVDRGLRIDGLRPVPRIVAEIVARLPRSPASRGRPARRAAGPRRAQRPRRGRR